MPKAKTNNTLPRRTFIERVAGGALLAGIAPAAPAATMADAGLLTLCGEFDNLERAIQASLFAGAGQIANAAEGDRFRLPLHDRQDAILGDICSLRATTREGLRARARTYTLWWPEALNVSDASFWDERMLAALLRDLLA